MIRKILAGLGLLILLVLIVAAFQPDDLRVERQATIAAPAAVVFAKVNDFTQWPSWSPWEKLDPNMKRTLSGPTSGKGAIYAWTGNSDVGEGRMTITDSRPGELVRIHLEFIKPFAATNTTDFAFKPEGGQTAVTWTMTGKNNYMSKLFGLFMNMDKMIGGDFERGLAQLKAVSEGARKT